MDAKNFLDFYIYVLHVMFKRQQDMEAILNHSHFSVIHPL